MSRILPPADLVRANDVEVVELPDSPMTHRLIDALLDAQRAQLLTEATAS